MDLSFIPLENDFVRLEPLEQRHRDGLRALAADESLWTHTALNAARDFDTWFDTMMASNAKGAQMSYAVFDKPRSVYAGHTSYLSLALDQQRLEIGWTWYGGAFHRSYVNPSCKRLLMGYAFESGAERVELKTRGTNLRSQGAMAKMGAIREGVLRSHVKVWNGERRDSVFFSVLKNEWPGVREGLDKRLERFQS